MGVELLAVLGGLLGGLLGWLLEDGLLGLRQAYGRR